jgi:hypothetical protein
MSMVHVHVSMLHVQAVYMFHAILHAHAYVHVATLHVYEHGA